MNHSESIAKLTAALAKVQGELGHAHKNATNPHFKNRYADLTEVIDTVRPVLAKHGLSVVQFPGYVDGVTTLESVLLHESGEWISGTAGARMQKDDPQGVGSALTYLRRYSLAAVCGIGQDDDDGEAASGVPTPAQQRAYGNPAKQEPNGNGGSILDALVGVGKHKGAKWGDLVRLQPDYVEWAIEKMDRLSTADKDMLRTALAATPQPVPLSEPDDNLPF